MKKAPLYSRSRRSVPAADTAAARAGRSGRAVAGPPAPGGLSRSATSAACGPLAVLLLLATVLLWRVGARRRRRR